MIGFEDECERRVVEGRISRLEQEAFVGEWGERFDDISALPDLDRLPNEARRIARPVAMGIVDIDDG
jgi:hypothetical protein